jgi:hypothetical protein
VEALRCLQVLKGRFDVGRRMTPRDAGRAGATARQSVLNDVVISKSSWRDDRAQGDHRPPDGDRIAPTA